MLHSEAHWDKNDIVATQVPFKNTVLQSKKHKKGKKFILQKIDVYHDEI